MGATADCSRGKLNSRDEENNKGDNLHVSGLARSVTQVMLDEMFNKHGRVSVDRLCDSEARRADSQVYKAELMTDPHTRKSSLKSTGRSWLTVDRGVPRFRLRQDALQRGRRGLHHGVERHRH